MNRENATVDMYLRAINLTPLEIGRLTQGSSFPIVHLHPIPWRSACPPSHPQAQLVDPLTRARLRLPLFRH